MAICSLEELMADACTNGFLCLDENTQAAIELQLLKEAAGDTSTLQELKDQACANGFYCQDESQFNAVALQLLCNAEGGAPSVDLVLEVDSGAADGIIWTWNQIDPTNWSVQQSSDGVTGWFELSLELPAARTINGLTSFNYFRVVVVGGDFDGTISNAVFLTP